MLTSFSSNLSTSREPSLRGILGPLIEPIPSWFELVDGGAVRVDTLWRIVAAGRVQATSADHGHRFGLPQPVDSAARATLALSNTAVRRASIVRDTGDVVLELDSRLEILTTSSGYEGWSIFSPNVMRPSVLVVGQLKFGGVMADKPLQPTSGTDVAPSRSRLSGGMC
jgi:hypothetical protein